MRKILFILMIWGLINSLHAQRNVERLVIFNPFFNPETEVIDKTEWINALSGWAEFGGYFYGNDRSHAWYQKLGTFMEFYRTPGGASLSLLGNIEFIADPNNGISFNPRAIFWEEAFLFTVRSINNNYWQLGYYHRCKHDIDNLIFGSERSLIYGSFHGRFITETNIGEKNVGVLALKTDVYTILQDARNPIETEIILPNVNNLTYSLSVNYNLKNMINKSIGIYFNLASSLDFYSIKNNYFDKWISVSKVRYNGGVEGGIYFSGKGRFKIGVRYEHLSDTGLEVIPQKGNLISLGIVLEPKEIF